MLYYNVWLYPYAVGVAFEMQSLRVDYVSERN